MKYPVLDQMIESRGVRKRTIAKRINVTERTLCRKLDGVSPFTLEEAKELQRHFFPDVPIQTLFSTEQ